MSGSDLPQLPSFESQRGALDKLCDVCGQRFDTKNQEQVFHHGLDSHEPLLVEDLTSR